MDAEIAAEEGGHTDDGYQFPQHFGLTILELTDGEVQRLHAHLKGLDTIDHRIMRATLERMCAHRFATMRNACVTL